MTETREPDLTICDREPITTLDLIQDFGFLVALSSDWTVVRASANLAKHIGIEAEIAVGMQFQEVLSQHAQHDIRNRMGMLYATGSERMYGVKLLPGKKLFDLNLHFADDLLIIEGEPALAGDGSEAASTVRAMAARLGRADSMTLFNGDAARQVRAITGFDRVMIYRFEETGAGEVIAEALQAGVESFLGLHYPASDIPVQARALYLKSPFRIIADVGAVDVPILPRASKLQPELDLSMAVTRAVSGGHIEYLRNMGVAASMSISIIVEGRLWGLIACHHRTPRLPTFIARTAAELFGSMYSMMLESRVRQGRAEEEQRARTFADRLMTAIAGDDSLLVDPQWLQDMTREMIECDGVAIYRGGQVFTYGSTPDNADVIALTRHLNLASPSRIFDTDRLLEICPAVSTAQACGVLSIPISRMPRDYILLFRRERIHSISWGGDPTKMWVASDDGVRLSPRKSFAAFVETVKGRAAPFSDPDRRTAESVRLAMIEVILRLNETAGDDRKRASERQELLIAELNHRVRNILALIRGLITQTGSNATDVASYVASLNGRVQSLARAHDQVTRQNWAPSLLASLFDNEIAAHTGAQGRILLEGPAILLKPEAISTLALVVHELITNSVKYGALSTDGTIVVETEIVPGDGVALRWRERGGPVVQAPTRRGFGSVIVERTIPFDLAGRAEVRYALGGLEADFVIPENHISLAPEAPAAAVAATPTAAEPAAPAPCAKPLEGVDVLLLEDNMIIAMEAEDMLRLLDARDIVSIATLTEAEAALADGRFGFAMLDINIGGRTSFAFASRVKARGIPYIFASGYGDQVALDRDHAGVTVVQKPYERGHLERAVAQALPAAAAAPAKAGD